MNPSTDIGAYIKRVVGTVPTNDDGSAAVEGAAVDRTGYNSCVLEGSTGVATGSPTTQTFDLKLQESSTGTSAWTDITSAAITQVAADNGYGSVHVSLETVKQYIRAVHTVAFTGGSSPAWPVQSGVILGGADKLPAA
jgi:hypothetical protein